MNHKITYEQLYLILDQEWNKTFEDDDIIGINEHCDQLILLIESCGWKTDDFIRKMVSSSTWSN